MSEDLLKDIKGQLLLLRNDILLMQHSIDKMDERIKKLAEAKQQEQTAPANINDSTLASIWGDSTTIEKL